MILSGNLINDLYCTFSKHETVAVSVMFRLLLSIAYNLVFHFLAENTSDQHKLSRKHDFNSKIFCYFSLHIISAKIALWSVDEGTRDFQ